MPKQREPFNPFYALLVVLGVVFLVTACAYYVMAFRALRPAPGGVGQGPASHPLTDLLDRQGIAILGWELGLLAAATFAAMGLDRFRSLRQQRREALDRAPTAAPDLQPRDRVE